METTSLPVTILDKTDLSFALNRSFNNAGKNVADLNAMAGPHLRTLRSVYELTAASPDVPKVIMPAVARWFESNTRELVGHAIQYQAAAEELFGIMRNTLNITDAGLIGGGTQTLDHVSTENLIDAIKHMTLHADAFARSAAAKRRRFDEVHTKDIVGILSEYPDFLHKHVTPQIAATSVELEKMANNVATRALQQTQLHGLVVGNPEPGVQTAHFFVDGSDDADEDGSGFSLAHASTLVPHALPSEAFSSSMDDAFTTAFLGE
jgi:hypothetical protein